MNKVRVFVGVATLVVAALIGFKSHRSVASGPPEIYAPQSAIDLGQVTCRADGINCRFSLENVGSGDLRLLRIVSGCTCTNAVAEPETIAPGATGTVSAKIKPLETGPGRVTLLLFTNDPVRPRLELTAEWNAVAAVKFDRDHVEFGEVNADEAYEQVLSVVESDSGIDIESVTSERKLLTASVIDNKTIRVALRPQQSFGDHRDRLNVHLTGAGPSTIRIPASWSVRGSVEAIPSQLFLGSGKTGQEVHGLLKISLSSVLKESALDIQAKSLDGGLEISRDDADPLTLRIRRRLPEKLGLHNESVTLKAGNDALHVPVRYFVLEASAAQSEARK